MGYHCVKNRTGPGVRVGAAKYRQCYGSRRQVWNGTAYRNYRGGLARSDLVLSHGRLVSKAKSQAGMRRWMALSASQKALVRAMLLANRKGVRRALSPLAAPGSQKYRHRRVYVSPMPKLRRRAAPPPPTIRRRKVKVQ